MIVPSFSVTRLTCARSHQPLFEPVSFTLKSGELLYIAGPNGIGKTTLLRCLAGFSQPTSGHVAWNGSDILYLGHKNTIKAGLTVFENVKWSLSLRRKYPNDQILTALETIGLAHKRDELAKNLSAGQKQRLALINLRLSQSLLWILDEPLTALDAVGSELAQDLIRQQSAKGGIAIFTSHQTPRLLKDRYRYLPLTAPTGNS